MLVTGVRRGELLALRWSDIDFENKRITIDESDSKDRSWRHENTNTLCPTIGQSERIPRQTKRNVKI